MMFAEPRAFNSRHIRKITRASGLDKTRQKEFQRLLLEYGKVAPKASDKVERQIETTPFSVTLDEAQTELWKFIDSLEKDQKSVIWYKLNELERETKERAEVIFKLAFFTTFLTLAGIFPFAFLSGKEGDIGRIVFVGSLLISRGLITLQEYFDSSAVKARELEKLIGSQLRKEGGLK